LLASYFSFTVRDFVNANEFVFFQDEKFEVFIVLPMLFFVDFKSFIISKDFRAFFNRALENIPPGVISLMEHQLPLTLKHEPTSLSTWLLTLREINSAGLPLALKHWDMADILKAAFGTDVDLRPHLVETVLLLVKCVLVMMVPLFNHCSKLLIAALIKLILYPTYKKLLWHVHQLKVLNKVGLK
jgi:hypothetical protein